MVPNVGFIYWLSNSRALIVPCLCLGSSRRRLHVSVEFLGSRRSGTKAANHSYWSMRRSRAGPYHFSKQIYIVISFARHFFANRMEHFKKSGPTIHTHL